MLTQKIPVTWIANKGANATKSPMAENKRSIWQSKVSRSALLLLILFIFVTLFLLTTRGSPRGTDRACCIMNQRNVQLAVRKHQERKKLKPYDPIDWKEIFGVDLSMEKEPVCPKHGKYTFKANVPVVGELAVECSLSAHPDNHVPGDHHDW